MAGGDFLGNAVPLNIVAGNRLSLRPRGMRRRDGVLRARRRWCGAPAPDTLRYSLYGRCVSFSQGTGLAAQPDLLGGG
jgi:hypothetical protein